jgi:dTDP-4-dehydrorhamnose reductase
MKVAVLGASGMLGSMVLKYLAAEPALQLIGTVRSPDMIQKEYRSVEWRFLDSENCEVEKISDAIKDCQWVINAIGIIKPFIHEDNPAETERALLVNSLFPHLLAKAASKTDCRVIQIATDCVYRGTRGHYIEKDGHDPLDAYGKTKSLGEVYSNNVHHLRCSIIGPELKGHVSLMDWFLGQPQNAAVSGYTNHLWNGVSTLHFGKLCLGIIKNSPGLPHVQHIVPDGELSKCEMLQIFAREYRRQDIKITPAEAREAINRTLATNNTDINLKLWSLAGYRVPPSVPEMVREMAEFTCKSGGKA